MMTMSSSTSCIHSWKVVYLVLDVLLLSKIHQIKIFFILKCQGVLKRAARGHSSIFQRWIEKSVFSESESSNKDDSKIDVDFKADSDDERDFSEKFDLNDIGDLLELCQQQGTLKNISLLIYMTLRYFSISWREIDNFLQQIGGTRCETAHKWAKIYLTDDLIEFNIDNRRGKVSGSFYDTFSDIENEAKFPSELSCKQDLGYRNVSRSSKFRYKIIMVSSTKILDTDITRSCLQIRKILGSDCRYLETNVPSIVTFSY